MSVSDLDNTSNSVYSSADDFDLHSSSHFNAGPSASLDESRMQRMSYLISD